MSEVLNLYRGDYQMIDQFRLSKTSSLCLFGRGIYLTDNPKVAKTYREKGSDKELWQISIEAPNKDAAIVIALKDYKNFRNGVSKHNRQYDLANKAFDSLSSEKKRVEILWFRDLIDDQSIAVTRSPMKISSGQFSFLFKEERIVGYLSTFRFGKEEFENKLFKFENWRRLHSHLEDLMQRAHERRRKNLSRFRLRTMSANQFAAAVSLRTGSNIDSPHDYDWNVLVKQLKREGFCGLEYSGGRMTNSIRHRAFSIWDENLINNRIS